MTKRYNLEVAPAAIRQIKKLPKNIQKTILNQFNKLQSDPRPQGVKKLANSNNFYRVRIGDYRIIYTIDDQVLIILILKVGNRREVYRNLSLI